jgi:hypothetical protein
MRLFGGLRDVAAKKADREPVEGMTIKNKIANLNHNGFADRLGFQSSGRVSHGHISDSIEQALAWKFVNGNRCKSTAELG